MALVKKYIFKTSNDYIRQILHALFRRRLNHKSIITYFRRMCGVVLKFLRKLLQICEKRAAVKRSALGFQMLQNLDERHRVLRAERLARVELCFPCSALFPATASSSEQPASSQWTGKFTHCDVRIFLFLEIYTTLAKYTLKSKRLVHTITDYRNHESVTSVRIDA